MGASQSSPPPKERHRWSISNNVGKPYYNTELCPPGYAEIGNNCMKTLGKINDNDPEYYDENLHTIVYKKYIDERIIKGRTTINPKEQMDNPDMKTYQYINVLCPSQNRGQSEIGYGIPFNNHDSMWCEYDTFFIDINFPAREVIQKPKTDAWRMYCLQGNNMTKDDLCKNAYQKNNLLNSQDIKKIYNIKCYK